VRWIDKLFVVCIPKALELVIFSIFYELKGCGHYEGLGFIKKGPYNYTNHQGRVGIKDGDTFATLRSKIDIDTSRFLRVYIYI
jgi:hypothetical protein